MTPLLYADLTPWYRMLDPTEDHQEEADVYADALVATADGPVHTLVELGAGAGNNAAFLKQRFRCTLADIAEPMLALSRALNPECAHVVGDMRSLRLDATFDAVLIHDAIAYMTSVADLRAAIDTAFVHTRPGGAALFAPDSFRETYQDSARLHQHTDGSRALRCIEWDWDPDPADDTCMAEFAFLLRDGNEMTAVHDRHTFGLFSRDTWLRVVADAGFAPSLVERAIEGNGDDPFTDEVIVGRRPLRS